MRSVEPSPEVPQPIAPSSLPSVAISRGRPTPARAAAIDAAIRAAALEVFLAGGFDAATMEQVAQRAEVSKGTLYARFEGKASLFRAVVEDELVRWSDRAGQNDHLLSEELGPRLRQHARILISVYGWPEYRRMIHLVEGALATMPDLARDWDELGANRYLEFLADDMAKVSGDVSADWDFLARVFMFSITGWQQNASGRQRSDEEALTAFADQVVAMIELAVARAR